MKKEINKDWEREFDEEFIEWWKNREEIKIFIRKLLQKTIDEQ